MTPSTARSLVFAINCLLLAAPAVAQVTTATFYGLVRDPSGSMLPGATVTMTHEETGAARTTTTNGSGEFVVSALPVGPYEVKIELQGFKAHVRRGVQLTSGQSARETFELELGAISENVTVEGVAALV